METHADGRKAEKSEKGCTATINNLLTDRVVTQDCQRGRKNLNMASIDVGKAYDSVDHG